MPLKFDPLEYRSELEAAGVPPVQAQVHAKILGRVLAQVPCMRDLEKMHSELRDFVTLKIEALRAELIACIENVRAEVATLRADVAILRADVSTLRAEIKSVKYELVIHRWMFGVVVAMQGVTIGMVMRVMP